MKIASVADVKAKLSAYLKESREGPIVVTRNGKPIAVLVGVEDEAEIERLLLTHSRRLRAILDRSRKQIEEGKSLDHDAFWAEAESLGQGESERPTKKRNLMRH